MAVSASHLIRRITAFERRRSPMKKLLLCLIVVLSGCANLATGPDFTPAPTPPQGSALVYLMRSPLIGGDENEVVFALDGQDVVSLQSKGYSWLYLPVGRHHVKSEQRSLLHGAGGRMNIVLDVQSEGPYFVERVDTMRQYPQYLSELKIVDPRQAGETIKTYKYTPVSATPSASDASPEPKLEANKALVYLYRSSRQSAHIDIDIILSADGKKVCSMEDRHYTLVSLEPGRHQIKAEWNPWKKPFFADAYADKSLDVTVEAGKKYYVGYQISGQNGTLFGTKLVEENEAQAQPNLSLATYQRDCIR
jgi:hypothetical protein